MNRTCKYFIDDDHTNHLLVECDVSEGWTIGGGDKTYVEISGISLNGVLSLRITDIKFFAPEWWAGINEQIRKEQWEQVQQAA